MSGRRVRPLNEHGEELIARLRMLRERIGLTQEQAGQKLSGSRYQLHRIETGRIPLHSELLALLQLYNASAEEVLAYLRLWELAWQPGGRIRERQLRRPVDS
jgi:transcriptional regulator with XRE-family HTH domain